MVGVEGGVWGGHESEGLLKGPNRHRQHLDTGPNRNGGGWGALTECAPVTGLEATKVDGDGNVWAGGMEESEHVHRSYVVWGCPQNDMDDRNASPPAGESFPGLSETDSGSIAVGHSDSAGAAVVALDTSTLPVSARAFALGRLATGGLCVVLSHSFDSSLPFNPCRCPGAAAHDISCMHLQLINNLPGEAQTLPPLVGEASA